MSEIKKDKIYRDHWRMLQQKRQQHIDLENKLDDLKLRLYLAKTAIEQQQQQQEIIKAKFQQQQLQQSTSNNNNDMMSDNNNNNNRNVAMNATTTNLMTNFIEKNDDVGEETLSGLFVCRLSVILSI